MSKNLLLSHDTGIDIVKIIANIVFTPMICILLVNKIYFHETDGLFNGFCCIVEHFLYLGATIKYCQNIFIPKFCLLQFLVDNILEHNCGHFCSMWAIFKILALAS